MSSRKKILLILNPIAGKMRAQNVDIPALFPEYNVTTYRTKDGASCEAYVADNAASYDIVVCAGGDGTLHHVINGMMHTESKPPLGYIPCGTTNDFAAGLGIPRDIPRAAAAICAGKPRMIDVGAFGNRYFSYVASFGAFTESSYKAPQESKNRMGRMAYFFEAVREFPHIRPSRMTVETDSGRFEGEYIFGAVSNATSLGGMLHLSSDDVVYDDGLFEVMLIPRPRSVLDWQHIIFSLLRRQYDSEYITFFKARHVVFSMEQVLPWSLDGEYASGDSTVEIQIHPRAVPLLL